MSLRDSAALTGEDTGIVVKTYRMVGGGENALLEEEYKVDVAFPAEWRTNERYVSEELGQLSKARVGGASKQPGSDRAGRTGNGAVTFDLAANPGTREPVG